MASSKNVVLLACKKSAFTFVYLVTSTASADKEEYSTILLNLLLDPGTYTLLTYQGVVKI